MKKIKDTKVSQKNILPGAIFSALIVAVIIFIVMLNTEKNMLLDYEKGMIYTTIKSIPQGQVITEINYIDYFVEKEIDKTLVTDAAITSFEQLIGLFPVRTIEKGTMVSKSMFESVNEITKNMKDPVEVGLKADDLYQVVGGILRTGDNIHIYTVEESETGEVTLVWPDVYVNKVFDTSGLLITNEDNATSASRINILLEKEYVEEFYKELALGSLRVVKEQQ